MSGKMIVGKMVSRKMITEEQLETLKEFGKEEDGSYCDRWEFSIKKHYDDWCFWHFNEVNGELYFIKKLKSMEDLKNVYRAITNKPLGFKRKGEENSKFLKKIINETKSW